MRRRVQLLLTLLVAAGVARGDTIILKNGRRITATQVVDEGKRVSYETPAGRLSLPRSIVARIERDGALLSSQGAAELSVHPPQVEFGEEYDDVVRATVYDGAIDWDYLAHLESQARSGGEEAGRAALAHYVAAQFELRRGQIEQATDHYRRALTFAPQHLGVLLNLSYLHLRQGEYTKALDYLERARRVAPDSADVAKLLGWGYYGLNRLDQAVEEWKRALRLRPDADVSQALEKAQRDQQTESDYREGETSHFTLRYHGGAAPALARAILRTLEEHFRALESELSFTPQEPIGVILYTEQAFADITRAPGWVGALNDGRIRLPVQGLTAVPPELSRILKHELTHSFAQQKTRGRCPVWLQEGIAQWMEGSRSRDSANLLVNAYEKKASLPLADLESSWMNLSGSLATYAYAWSLAVVEGIVRTSGTGDIERLLDRIAAEPSTEAAVRSALHMDYPELEKHTVEYLRRTYVR